MDLIEGEVEKEKVPAQQVEQQEETGEEQAAEKTQATSLYL